jgi:hemerythrin
VPQIEWTASLHTGIAEVDAQHEHLTGLINHLYHSYMQGREHEVLSPIIDEIAEYARYHFETEEALMHRTSYPETADHVAAHHDFRDRSIDFLLAYQVVEKQPERARKARRSMNEAARSE